jgi:Uma2 family endonuclease
MQTATIDRSKEWTVTDYLQLEESNLPCELINGELFMSPAPNPHHQRILRRLFRLLDRVTKEDEVFIAPIDLFISSQNVFQPDLAYVSENNKDFITNRGIEGPPEIIIEIISPSNVYTDRNQKKKSYLAFGVKEYWIVDPANKTIEIYTPETGLDSPMLYLAEEGQVSSKVLPNLTFNVSEIFNP